LFGHVENVLKRWVSVCLMWQHRDTPQTLGWDRQRRAQKVTRGENVHSYQLTLRKNIDLQTETRKKKTCYINSAQKHWPTWRNTDKQLLPASENSERKYWRTWRRLNKNICKHQANNINIDLRKVLKNQNITTHQILLKILVHVHWMETLVNVYQVIFDKFGQI